MNFYAYIPKKNNDEPLGSANRFIVRNKYKTVKSFLRYYLNNSKEYTVYSFSDFYDNNTFKLIQIGKRS